ncbi:MAG: hypothetical protein HY717_17065 [Planctomycetes bacterium]|nr:hypothetical protein [Planctomycetota bacterium]
MFALVHENSVHSFALVLVIFLLGLAGGAALAKSLLERGASAKASLAIAWCASGLWTILSPRLFLLLSPGMDYLVAGGSAAQGIGLLWRAALILLPATLAAGAALSLLLELAGGGRNSPAGLQLGRLLAANTAGSVLGPLLANTLPGAPAWASGGASPWLEGRWGSRERRCSRVFPCARWRQRGAWERMRSLRG